MRVPSLKQWKSNVKLDLDEHEFKKYRTYYGFNMVDLHNSIVRIGNTIEDITIESMKDWQCSFVLGGPIESLSISRGGGLELPERTLHVDTIVYVFNVQDEFTMTTKFGYLKPPSFYQIGEPPEVQNYAPMELSEFLNYGVSTVDKNTSNLEFISKTHSKIVSILKSNLDTTNKDAEEFADEYIETLQEQDRFDKDFINSANFIWDILHNYEG